MPRTPASSPTPGSAAPATGTALAVRRLLRGARSATLATRQGPDGAPYASLVTVATDHDARPILLLSGLADHTRNLEADPRASLLIDDARHLPNPQTGPRVTLMGRAEKVSDPVTRERLSARFLARHPAAELYAGFGDFAFWTLRPERAHFVGGFARAVWLERGLCLDGATAAAFAAAEATMVTELNASHGATVAALAATVAMPPVAPAWMVCAVDADGIVLRNDGDAVTFHVMFDPPFVGPADILPRLHALIQAGRVGGGG